MIEDSRVKPLIRYAKDKHRRMFKEYMSFPRKCVFCKKELSYEKRNNKFCNSSCSALFNNKKLHRHRKDYKFCLNCSRKLKYYQKKFCSNGCFVENRWNVYVKFVKKTKMFPVKNASSANPIRRVKRFIQQERGRKCEICGIIEWMGQLVPLVLDHIDGNAENWKLKNCRLICRNCDGLLPTFAGRNRGRGSKQRYSWRMK